MELKSDLNSPGFFTNEPWLPQHFWQCFQAREPSPFQYFLFNSASSVPCSGGDEKAPSLSEDLRQLSGIFCWFFAILDWKGTSKQCLDLEPCTCDCQKASATANRRCVTSPRRDAVSRGSTEAPTKTLLRTETHSWRSDWEGLAQTCPVH